VTPPPPLVSDAARRARLAQCQHLARPAPGTVPDALVGAAHDLVGVHASDPATVYLSLRARVPAATTIDIEAALYDDRTLARVLGMRRTMFVVPSADAQRLRVGCTTQLVAGERRRLIEMLEGAGVAADCETWLDDVLKRTRKALRTLGTATAAELTAEVPELGISLEFGQGKRWAGSVGLSTRVLFLLATEGTIVRGRPRGSWRSSQYAWSSWDEWFPPAATVRDRTPGATPEEARRHLLYRWLVTYGPGTMVDLRWWSGWTARQVSAALAEIDTRQVSLADGSVGYVAAESFSDVTRLADIAKHGSLPLPRWAALLPGLDQAVMGWKERAWFLPADSSELFDRNGNVGPTVWVDGRVVGGWAQQADGSVVWQALEGLDEQAQELVAAERAALQEWLGDAVVIPRFRTPLERRLSAR
jgi:hypothetical protein